MSTQHVVVVPQASPSSSLEVYAADAVATMPWTVSFDVIRTGHGLPFAEACRPQSLLAMRPASRLRA